MGWCSASDIDYWAPCLPSQLTAPLCVCQKHTDRNSATKTPCYTWVLLARKFSLFHRQKQKKKKQSGIQWNSKWKHQWKRSALLWKRYRRSLHELLPGLSSPGCFPGSFKGPLMHHGQLSCLFPWCILENPKYVAPEGIFFSIPEYSHKLKRQPVRGTWHIPCLASFFHSMPWLTSAS